MSVPVNPAKGMRDLLPEEKRKRENAIIKIKQVYNSFGYDEIETPALETVERLLSSEGGENLSLIFQTIKRGLDPGVPIAPREATDFGLRYDLTVPLARYYATNSSKLPSVFRSIQIGSVWRGERPQKGRFRQFTQCDIDIIGIADERAEVELISITILALEALSILNTTVRLNDRRLLISLLSSFGFPPSIHNSVLISLDKLDKIGPAGVVKELEVKNPDVRDAVRQLADFLEGFHALEQSGDYKFQEVIDLFPDSTPDQVLEALQFIIDNVSKGVSSARVRFDPTLVRGMGYYTGPIFEIEVLGMKNSIAGGGRYDGMIGRFAKRTVPACGFSLGFERLVDLFAANSEEEAKRLVIFYDKQVTPGVVLCNQRLLISEGYEVRAMSRPKKLGKAIDVLATEGFTAFVELRDNDQQIVCPEDIRPIVKR